MRSAYLVSFLATFCATCALAAAEEPKPRKPCTIKSSTSGLEFDLNGLAVLPKEQEDKGKDSREESWIAKGYDYGINFTMNFCAPVVENLEDVQGIDEKLWRNVSAYYKREGEVYSIGY